MRKDFENCVKNGGRVRIKQLKNNKSIRICYDKEGNSFSGGITVGKPVESNKENKVEQQQVDVSKSLSEKILELQNHINAHYHT
jgi:putative hemolysin